MSTISDHLINIQETLDIMNSQGLVTEPDEFVAVKDIEIAVNRAKKVFERTKQKDKQQ